MVPSPKNPSAVDIKLIVLPRFFLLMLFLVWEASPFSTFGEPLFNLVHPTYKVLKENRQFCSFSTSFKKKTVSK